MLSLSLFIAPFVLIMITFQSIIASPTRIDGYLSSMWSPTCDNNKVSAVVQEAIGVCVKIFEGPEDPTTEVPSYKMELLSMDEQTINLSKQYYTDSLCTVVNGDAVKLSYNIGKCNSQDGLIYQNVTKNLSPPATQMNGWTIMGFQQPSQCSSSKDVTWNAQFANDNCFPISGTTSKKVKFSSFTGYCSGKQFTQTFYSDSACMNIIPNSALVVKLGGDTTCYINDKPDFDYNLFETMMCIGNALPPKETPKDASLVSMKDLPLKGHIF